MSTGPPSAPGAVVVVRLSDQPCSQNLDLRTTHRHHPRAVVRARAFWLVALAFTVILLGTTVPAPLYVVYQAEWGFSAGVLTLIFAVYAAGVLTALLLFGRLSDEIGRTRVLLAAIAVAAVSTLVFLFATGITMLFLARLLSGLSAGLAQGTATAALVELEPNHDVRRAALTGSAVTSGAVGLGPLLSGLLAEYAGWQTHLVFVVYLALLTLAAVAMLLVPETVAPLRRPTLRVQRLSVPVDIRAEFVSPALAMFAAFAVIGLFVSLVPSFLGGELHERNHAAAGIVVFTLFAFATGAQIVLHGLMSRRAMTIGIGWLLVGLILLLLGLSQKELSIFVVATIFCGIGVGLVIMGALAMVNRIAPPEHRGETLSSLFVAAYLGLSIPAIGVGIASARAGFFRSTLVCSVCVAALLVFAAVRLISGSAKAPAGPTMAG